MLRLSLVLAILLWAVAGTSSADEPRGKPRAIEFDSKLSFPCREVTPKDFALANRDRKVVEATLRISANFAIDEKEIESIVYRIMLPSHLEIADHLPKTELVTDVVGTVDSRQQTATRTNLLVSFEAGGKIGYRLPTVLEAEARASGGGKDEKANEVSSGVQVRFLPPRQLLIAAGTQDRGQTLYFKLRPFSQTTLEGEKEFAFLLVVPREWAGDNAVLDCTAYQKGYKDVVAQQALGVGLYMSGDRDARVRVEKLARETKTSSTSVLATKNDGPAAQPAGVAGLTCAACAGKYTFTHQLYETTATLTKDGSWEGWNGFRGLTKLSRVKGTWSIKDGKLTLIQTHDTGIPLKLVIFNDVPIKDFDEKAGVLFLEGGRKLSR
jgi:hypothetical protein